MLWSASHWKRVFPHSPLYETQEQSWWRWFYHTILYTGKRIQRRWRVCPSHKASEWQNQDLYPVVPTLKPKFWAWYHTTLNPVTSVERQRWLPCSDLPEMNGGGQAGEVHYTCQLKWQGGAVVPRADKSSVGSPLGAHGHSDWWVWTQTT